MPNHCRGISPSSGKPNIMRNLLILTGFFWLAYLPAGTAQQSAQFTQFTFNKLNFNPSLTGAYEALTFTGFYRHQWFGVEGAPRTGMVNVVAPLTRHNTVLGLAVSYDQIGMTQTGQATASYAYVMRMPSGLQLLGGLSGTVEYGRVDWSMADPGDLGDQLLGTGMENIWKPNFGAGLTLHNRSWYVGVSVPRFLKNALFRGPKDQQGSAADYREIYGMAGFDVGVSPGFRIRPGVLMSYNPAAPLDLGFDLSVLLMNQFILGAAYRLDDAVSAIVQYRLSSQWKMGLGYDMTVSPLNEYSNGTAEIMLEYSLDRAVDGNRHIRFF